MSFAQRLAALRPTAVNRVLGEVRELQAAGRELVSLMRGQPDSPTPPHIVEALERAVRAGRTGYPDNQGEPVLRQAVAEKLARDNGLVYDPGREILVTDGATCGLCTALGALVEPGDEVLLPDPIYDAYSSPIALWGGRPVGVPATIRAGRFSLDGAALEAAVTPRTRLLLLNSPWNPVGTVFTRDELRTLMEFAAARDLFVLSDEIYESLVYDGRRHISPASLSDDARQRTLVVNSLSKTYAMTGWRVGYCAGPAELIGAMLMVLQQFSRGPATFVQDAAAVALRSDSRSDPDARSVRVTAAMTSEYQSRRDLVVNRLRGIPGVDVLVPEGGLFVMVDVRSISSHSRNDPKSRAVSARSSGESTSPPGRHGPALCDSSFSDAVRRFLLREAGVVVIHGAAYGPGGEGTLRVSFAAGGMALERGLDRLREGLLRLADEGLPEEKG